MKRADILLVDDDPDIREAISLILNREGFDVRTASGGAAALMELDRKVPDLLILDVMMSTETEGFDLAYTLRDRQELKDLPIILLTSFLERVRQEGPETFQHVLGEIWPAEWIFEKPVDPKELVAKIRGLLEQG